MTTIKNKYKSLVKRWGKVPVSLTLALVLVLMLAAAALAASVEPIRYPGSENYTCSMYFGDIEGLIEYKIEPFSSGDYTDGMLSVNIVSPSTEALTNQNSFDWSSNIAVLGVVVKDGVDGSNIYDYSDDPQMADTYLTTPFEGDKGISHVSFCYLEPEFVSVTACKVEDVDADPTTADDREPIEGWTVYLWKDGKIVDTQLTGKDGCYTWEDLDAGPTYGVSEEVPAGWFAWTPTFFFFDPSVPGGEYEYTFINSRLVEVTACKVEDVDADPTTAADRIAVEGWTVYLWKDGKIVDTQLTGKDGCYTWTDLEPGPTYGVSEEVPAGWFAWTPTFFFFDPSVSGGEYEYTFINSRLVEVTACKVEDVDADPTTAADRIAVEGWTVYLWKDGKIVDTQLTGKDGCYTWTDLEPGPTYGVSEEVPAGWFAWTPTFFFFDPSVSGGEYSYTFINSRLVEVTACKLEDVDADPTTAADRIAVEGWTVYLWKDGKIVDTQLTGKDGCYTWEDLEPGPTYGVSEEVPAGWFAWTPTFFFFDPSVSGGEYSYTFINSRLVEVTACKLQDLDGDLATTDDQVVLSGWTVNLWKDGKIVDTQLTGEDGCYTWTDLEPGATYGVSEEVPAGWIALTPTFFFFDRSVSGGEYEYTFINYKEPGCCYTQGYWKTHSKYGPAGPYDPTWDLKAGGDAEFFTTGLSWYQIFWTPPARGNAYIILAHQYMAAWLNINNVDPLKAADPTLVAATMAQAEALLDFYADDLFIPADSADRAKAIELASFLDMYNNGMLPGGPPHCDDVD
jgi:hypothetical protein